MSDKPQIQVKFLGSKDLIAAINQKLTSGPDEFVIERVGPEKDVTNLKFGVADIASIVARFNDITPFLKLAKSLYDVLQMSSGERIIVQTPLRRVEFTSKSMLTEKDIEQALASLVKVAKGK